MRVCRAWRGLPVVLVLLLTPLATPADEPLWEAGVGVGAGSFPEYRGSNERSEYAVPIPYLVYRGDRFRVGRDGARGVLAETPDYELDIDVEGAVPVESSDDGPRAGMEELDPILEVGPLVDWRLGRTAVGRWTLRLPVRAAVATDLRSASHEGWTFHPQIRLNAPDLVGSWDFRISLGPRYASRNFHAYYYDVAPGDVRPGREQYRAPGGYSGTALRMGGARRYGQLWVGAFVQYDNLSGAAFEDSPLVETKHAVAVGFGLSWVIRQSEAVVAGR